MNLSHQEKGALGFHIFNKGIHGIRHYLHHRAPVLFLHTQRNGVLTLEKITYLECPNEKTELHSVTTVNWRAEA